MVENLGFLLWHLELHYSYQAPRLSAELQFFFLFGGGGWGFKVQVLGFRVRVDMSADPYSCTECPETPPIPESLLFAGPVIR